MSLLGAYVKKNHIFRHTRETEATLATVSSHLYDKGASSVKCIQYQSTLYIQEKVRGQTLVGVTDHCSIGKMKLGQLPYQMKI